MDQLTPEAIKAAKAAAAIMAMNNVYYRFTPPGSQRSLSHHARQAAHVGDRRRLGVDKADFELWCMAVSAVNGCGMCMDAHEDELRKAGFTTEQIQASVRIGAVVNAVSPGRWQPKLRFPKYPRQEQSGPGLVQRPGLFYLRADQLPASYDNAESYCLVSREIRMRRRDVLWGAGAVGVLSALGCAGDRGPTGLSRPTKLASRRRSSTPIRSMRLPGPGKTAPRRRRSQQAWVRRATLSDHTIAPDHGCRTTTRSIPPRSSNSRADRVEVFSAHRHEALFQHHFHGRLYGQLCGDWDAPDEGSGRHVLGRGPRWTGSAACRRNRVPLFDQRRVDAGSHCGGRVPHDLPAAKALQQQITIKPRDGQTARSRSP